MTKFKRFYCDMDFETKINKFCYSNKIIKWERISEGSMVGVCILVEYEAIEDE